MVILAAFISPCTEVKTSTEHLDINCDAHRYSDETELIADEFTETTNEPLLGTRSYIRHLGSEGTVDAEVVAAPRRTRGSFGEDILGDAADGRRQFETTTMEPCKFEITLPQNYVLGQRVRVKGPHGFFSTRPPAGANLLPGSRQRVRLAPLPEFRVEVPVGVSPGSELKFAKEDGTEVSVTVPQDVTPGSFFDMAPPALMVQVPKFAMPGDLVIFSAEVNCGSGKVTSWCRAQVPQGFHEEEYFPARIPEPERVALRALDTTSYIRYLGSEGTVDAEVLATPRRTRSIFGEDLLEHAVDGRRQLKSVATSPCELEITLPLNYVPGQRVRAKGPHGFMSAPTPANPKLLPGSRQRVRLAPLPEFRVEVPPGVSPGSELKFARKDGTEISVAVPQSATPGSFFDVLPPALMVQVPKSAMPGDLVVFSAEVNFGSGTVTSWYRAQVPPGFHEEEYFPARIPEPEYAAL
mmetsp:Transcript_139775/g.445980  ORF Transcript_139775/g.445980 Transcript_139775/m.445980 type:complete len:466 (+) Transcript_139775:78-1475(+)